MMKASFVLMMEPRFFFLGYDCDPDENYQAEDRLMGLDIETPRTVSYLTHEDTIDQRLLEVLDKKVGKFNQVFGSKESLKNLLR